MVLPGSKRGEGFSNLWIVQHRVWNTTSPSHTLPAGASPGGISTASTVPATDEAAREHVRKSMESHRKQQSQHPAGTPPPVTPASRIRRRGTSHYEGLDTAGTKRQLVLTPSPVSNPDKEAKPKGKVKSSKAKAKGKASPSSSTSTKKVKKKTKKASRTQTEAKSKGKGSQKAAVKKDRSGPCLKAQIPPKSEEETPNGQKEAHRTSAQAVGNALGRAVTQANLGTPSPDQSKISGSPRSGPPPPPTEANSTEAPTKDGSPKKKIAKRYREKTREEKDAHNRFMKFSRSLRSHTLSRAGCEFYTGKIWLTLWIYIPYRRCSLFLASTSQFFERSYIQMFCTFLGPNSPKEIHAAGRAAKYCPLVCFGPLP